MEFEKNKNGTKKRELAKQTASETLKLVEFFHVVGKLKKTRKTGWVKNGVKEAETVSDHIARLAVMSLFLAGKLQCDSGKLVKLALVHDLHESICGDLTLDYTQYGSHAGISQQEKEKLEKEGMEKFASMLEGELAREFKALWLEAENGSTREAQVLKELDKLEMLFQASEYQMEKNGRSDLFELFDKVNKHFVKTPLLSEMLVEIEKKTQ